MGTSQGVVKNPAAPQDSMYQTQLDVDLDNVFGEDVEIVRMTLGNFPEDLNTDEIESTVIGESDGHGVISRMVKSNTSDRSYLFEIPLIIYFECIKLLLVQIRTEIRSVSVHL